MIPFLERLYFQKITKNNTINLMQNLQHMPNHRFNVQDYKKVLVWGLGVNGGGEGVAAYFAKLGAEVLVTDMKSSEDLAEVVKRLSIYPNVKFNLGKHEESDFLWADIIIRNPAIPPKAPLLKFCADNNKLVEMELSLFLKICKGKTIGITGTRGKSTTTALITDMLQKSGLKVLTGGNNRISLLQQLDQIDEETIVVIEMSSFQLSGVTSSPNVAVVTNMYPDHLNWHWDMQDYINAKLNIIKFQSESDAAVINLDNEITSTDFAPQVKGQKITFGKNDVADYRIAEDGLYNSENLKIIEWEKCVLGGEHNRYNLAGAVAAALACEAELSKVQDVAYSFTGLEYRQQQIAEINGIKFINDTTATTPEGVLAALERFSTLGKIHLIAGGVNKDLDLINLAVGINRHCSSLHLLAGTFYDEILPKLNSNLKQIVTGPHEVFSEATKAAFNAASAGDYVILSPGAASFNMFKNEFDRGEQFNSVVKSLAA